MSHFYLAIVFLISIGTTDSHALGPGDPMLFLINKLGIFTIVDMLLIFLVIHLLFHLHKNHTRELNKCMPFIFLAGSVYLAGFFAGRYSEFQIVGILGPEFRGLVVWCCILVCSTYISAIDQTFTKKFFFVWVSGLLFRALYERYFVGSRYGAYENSFFFDASFLMSCASMSIANYYIWLMQKKVVNFSGLIHLTLFTVFFIVVILGFRRASMIIAVLGLTVTTFLLLLLSGISKHRRLRIGGIFVMYICCAILSDIYLFNGRYGYRLMSFLFSGDVYNKSASDYYHFMEVMDAWRVIKEHPFLGAGIGAVISWRSSEDFGVLIPIHSPHLHSYLRLTLLGFLSYVALQIDIGRRTMRWIRLDTKTNNDLLIAGLAIGLFNYILFQFAFPPFYIDPKQSLIVGGVLGVMLGSERSRYGINPTRG